MGCFRGELFALRGHLLWGTFGIFVGNFKGTLIFNFWGMLTVPDGSFAELSFNSNRSCIKKETSLLIKRIIEIISLAFFYLFLLFIIYQFLI